MKEYMAKCIAEHAYRHDDDCHKGTKREEARLGLENLPKRQRMRSGGRRARSLDTRILKNFLRSRLGQSFDQVYAEVCQHNHLGSFNQWELRRELESLVEGRAIIVGSRPCGPEGLGLHQDFWVDPESGILMGAADSPRCRWQRRQLFDQVFIDKWTKYVRVDQIWYEVRFAPIPVAPEKAAVDVVFREKVVYKPQSSSTTGTACLSSGQLCRKYVAEWGGLVYAAQRRQLNKKEIRKLTKVCAGKQGN